MKKVPGFLLAIVGCAAMFSGGFVWSDIVGGRAPAFDRMNSIGQPTQAAATYAPTEVFRQNFGIIRDHYAFNINDDEVRYGAMAGMMASLGDPHTVFFEPRLAENFAVETTGNFEGIGARLQPNAMGAKIVTVFRDGPAERAGLLGGDIIISVDGESVAGVSVDDIVSKVRGPAKTRVILGISREGESQPLSITVPRGRVVVPNVEDKMIADGTVGYISIAQFSDAVSQQFDESIERVRRENPDGIVIDLRGNPGGLLERTAEMLGRFEEGATVVTMRKRDGQPEVVRSPRGRSLRWEMPVVILINEASASASEIFAGVLHDYNRATLIGEHTYGKASVQQVYPIRGGSGAKVTIARYYLPKSSDISRRVDGDGQYISGGLAPDIELELDLKPGGSLGDEDSDNQLARAIEFIQKGR